MLSMIVLMTQITHFRAQSAEFMLVITTQHSIKILMDHLVKTMILQMVLALCKDLFLLLEMEEMMDSMK